MFELPPGYAKNDMLNPARWQKRPTNLSAPDVGRQLLITGIHTQVPSAASHDGRNGDLSPIIAVGSMQNMG
jgi:hypothetical protein